MKQDFIDAVRENVESFSEMSDQDLEDLQQQCLFSEKEFVSYVLTRDGVDSIHYTEVADLLGVSPDTMWGKTDRCRKKLEKAEKTILVDSVFSS